MFRLTKLRSAAPWYVATDADEAGDRFRLGVASPSAIGEWGRPPPSRIGPRHAQAGVNLRRWWIDRLRGIEAPSCSLGWSYRRGDGVTLLATPRLAFEATTRQVLAACVDDPDERAAIILNSRLTTRR